MKIRGVFITIEGGDGAGKTSVISRLREHLEERGHEVLVTREPGGIEIAEQIRGVILDKKNTAMDPRTEALLYAAARRQHLVEKVEPALAVGKVVICDRFVDSSLAYQGYARGIGVDEVWSINAFAIKSLLPDLTLLFDLDPKVGMERIRASGSREVNRLDMESITFHEKVREGYGLLAKRFNSRIRVIDAGRSPSEVLAEAQRVVDSFLSGRLAQHGGNA